jgi:hypothetical protein
MSGALYATVRVRERHRFIASRIVTFRDASLVAALASIHGPCVWFDTEAWAPVIHPSRTAMKISIEYCTL